MERMVLIFEEVKDFASRQAELVGFVKATVINALTTLSGFVGFFNVPQLLRSFLDCTARFIPSPLPFSVSRPAKMLSVDSVPTSDFRLHAWGGSVTLYCVHGTNCAKFKLQLTNFRHKYFFRFVL